MTTFAHFAPGSGQALDPRGNLADVESYKASFGDVVDRLWSDHAFKEVPDGTLHGAQDNEDGTYTNPPPAPTTPRAITKAEFERLLADHDDDLAAALEDWPEA